jgi:hypothetical protein
LRKNPGRFRHARYLLPEYDDRVAGPAAYGENVMACHLISEHRDESISQAVEQAEDGASAPINRPVRSLINHEQELIVSTTRRCDMLIHVRSFRQTLRIVASTWAWFNDPLRDKLKVQA